MKARLLARASAFGIVNAAFTALSLAVLTLPANATSLVANGNFQQLLVPGVSAEFGTRHPSQQVTDWSTSGYNFVFTPGTADTTGAQGEYNKIYLWGPGNGSNNGLPATSPAGGNYLALDGAYAQAPITQTIHGLTPGHQVTLSFYFAGAQQKGFTGTNTEQFEVSLGSQNKFTPVLTNTSEGFTGWQKETMTFVPTGTSEVLSFLAIGTPNGVPPFSLLDGVSLAAAPEPASWAFLVFSGLIGFFGVVSLRRKSLRRAAASDKA